MATTVIEREIKLQSACAAEARAAVLAAGCTPLLGRRLQDELGCKLVGLRIRCFANALCPVLQFVRRVPKLNVRSQ